MTDSAHRPPAAPGHPPIWVWDGRVARPLAAAGAAGSVRLMVAAPGSAVLVPWIKSFR